jgi:signal transduction histidine kinase
MSFKLDIINILVILVALMNMVYGLIVYSRNRHDDTNFFFFLLTLCVSFWGVMMFLYRSFTDPSLDVFAARLLYVAAATIPFSFLYFVFIFPESKITLKVWQKYLLPLPFLIIVIISLFPDWLINGTILYTNHEYYIEFNKGFHTIYAIYIIGYFSWAYLLLLNNWRKSSGTLRLQFGYIIIGTIVSTFIGLITNLILPYFEIFVLNWFGQIGTVFMISMISYSIMKYKLFNVRVIATEIFTFTLWIFILVRTVTDQTLTDKLADSGLFTVTLVVGILLIRSVIREVRQREKMEKQEKALEIANEQQENFIHFLSHEVKGILGKNKAMFAYLLEGSGQDAAQGTSTSQAEQTISSDVKPLVLQSLNDTNQSVDMVIDILRSADLKTGRMKFDKKPFDFETSVLEAVAALKPEAEHKGLKLDVVVEPGMPYKIVGDREALSLHVVHNLIDNAVRYTLSGSITVRLAHGDTDGTNNARPAKWPKTVLFSVSDTGVGITSEDKSRLFTEGGHGKDSIKVNIHSTGYGLYFAKGIVEAHGGRIWAESEGVPGKGSTFFVELPVG